MNINPQYEIEIRSLLRQNKDAEAARYIQNVLNVSNTDAERLVQAVKNEIAQENQEALRNAANQTKGCGSMLLRIMSFGFGFFGIGFILLGIGSYFLFNYIETGAVEVQGRVIDLRENENGGLAPVIEYEWADKNRTLYSEAYSSPPDYEIGQTVSVWINPENPDNATIMYEEIGWIFIATFGGIGLFFLVVAIVLSRIRKKISNPL
ncbi:DUF3592 domain-containing protein [Oscillatoria amoena NRMC-F 0135]|nr:DUF3592 domain-containing protein [Oscillatoria amoena NRMC-F 0135]